MVTVKTTEEVARVFHAILKSDRDCIIGVGGFKGEGKSRLTAALCKDYAMVSGTYWGFDRMTWSRKELLLWIDGKEKSEVNAQGLREGQLPEYSAIIGDEIFDMFYKRNWFDKEQIDGISILNSCRDRHLLLIGNIPDFWQLDAGFLSTVRFYIYVVERGKAWMFQQENNPFSTDKWNVALNLKTFRKNKNPYRLPNFVCEIQFNDWTAEEKEAYYNVRNTKRVEAITKIKVERSERLQKTINQRNLLIKALINKGVSVSVIAELIDVSQEYISMIHYDIRGEGTRTTK